MMKTKSVSKFVCAALAVFAGRTLAAAVAFSTPFGDGMVLQRGRREVKADGRHLRGGMM